MAPDRPHELLAAITTFVGVVESGGFAAAARRLGTTRSAVSKQVARLEAAWGVKLLRRSTRAVSLTEPGLEAYRHAQQIPRLAALAEEAAASPSRSPRGRLRVTASVSFGQHRVVPLLPGFRQRHPEVSVELHLVDRRVDLVEEGFDVAIRLSAQLPEGLVARRLGAIRYALCASPALPGLDAVRSPEDLSSLPRLRLSGRPAHEAWSLSRGDQRASVAPDAALAASTSDALQTLALAGAGVAVLPDYVCGDALARGDLVRVLPEWTVHGPYGDTCWALRAPERRVLPKVQVFVAHLERAFAG